MLCIENIDRSASSGQTSFIDAQHLCTKLMIALCCGISTSTQSCISGAEGDALQCNAWSSDSSCRGAKVAKEVKCF